MQLTEMKANFLDMGNSERTAFIMFYTQVRRKDMEQSEVIIKAKNVKGERKSTPKTVKVTPDQLALMQKLGLV